MIGRNASWSGSGLSASLLGPALPISPRLQFDLRCHTPRQRYHRFARDVLHDRSPPKLCRRFPRTRPPPLAGTLDCSRTLVFSSQAGLLAALTSGAILTLQRAQYSGRSSFQFVKYGNCGTDPGVFGNPIFWVEARP